MNLNTVIDIFLHTPKYLEIILSQYSIWAYVILFAILFMETGVVVTPFLPGDSILFGIGSIVAITNVIDVPLMVFLLILAAIVGDTVNYHIGRALGSYLIEEKKVRFIKREYIERTQKFYEKHGGKTITIARFMPIIRTFAPFVAGISRMKYRSFLVYNMLGGILWICLMFGIGYFFGNIPMVKNHFSLVTIGIILVSLLPVLIAYLKSRKEKVAEA